MKLVGCKSEKLGGKLELKAFHTAKCCVSFFVKLGDADVCKCVGLGPLLWEDKLVDSGTANCTKVHHGDHAKVPFSLCLPSCLPYRALTLAFLLAPFSSALLSQPSITAALHLGLFYIFPHLARKVLFGLT